MSQKNLILIGAGGHAKACIEIIETAGEFKIAHVVGQESELGKKVLGYTIEHTDSDLNTLRDKYEYAFIGIGQMHNPDSRKSIYSNLVNLGFQIPTIISNHAIVSKYAKIGSGSIVMNGSIVNVDSRVGQNVILNTGALIDHDAIIGDHCHISTKVIVNGGSKIKQGTFVGSGTVVRNGIEIGENSFVAMGCVITESLLPNSTYKKIL